MPLYDQYRLANSKLTAPYQGSTLDELIKVSDVQQQRYDASQTGMDQIDEYLKNAKVLPEDQALWDQRKAEYKKTLAGFAQRGDLENITRDVYKAGKRLGDEYNNFASSYKSVMENKADLDKQIEAGHIAKGTADWKMAMNRAAYKGLKYDPNSGEYSNHYQGEVAAHEVDVNDWMHKAVGDAMASSGKSYKEVAGEYYIQGSGGGWRKLTEAETNNIWQKAYALDPKIQADFKQRSEIVGFQGSRMHVADLPDLTTKQVVNKKGKLVDVQVPYQLKSDIQTQIAQGVPEAEAMHDAFKDMKSRDLMTNMRQFASKYAFSETSSESKIDGLSYTGQASLKHVGEPDTLLSLAVTTPGAGSDIKSAYGFHDLQATTQADHDKTMADYSTWLKGKTVDYKTGHVYEMRNGEKVDVTDKADQFRSQIKSMRTNLDNLESVRKEAVAESGYDPGKNITPQLIKDAENAANDIYSGYRGVAPGTSKENAAAEDKHMKETWAAVKDEYIKTHSPGYAEYEKALKAKTSTNAETSSLVLIQDDQVRKNWSANLKALTSNLGLNEGDLSFTIGSGPDQGKQITARQYNGIQGDVEVAGFETDKEGNTIIKVRAFKDVQGAKTKGKDILMNLGHTDVDKWLQRNMSPNDFLNFKREGFLKSELNNATRRAEVEIPGTNAVAKIRLENDKWVVSLPGEGGHNEQIADSYQGILNILDQTAPKYK